MTASWILRLRARAPDSTIAAQLDWDDDTTRYRTPHPKLWLESGWCYLALFLRSARKEIADALGPFPAGPEVMAYSHLFHYNLGHIVTSQGRIGHVDPTKPRADPEKTARRRVLHFLSGAHAVVIGADLCARVQCTARDILQAFRQDRTEMFTVRLRSSDLTRINDLEKALSPDLRRVADYAPNSNYTKHARIILFACYEPKEIPVYKGYSLIRLSYHPATTSQKRVTSSFTKVF
jgi:hypothetical protein